MNDLNASLARLLSDPKLINRLNIARDNPEELAADEIQAYEAEARWRLRHRALEYRGPLPVRGVTEEEHVTRELRMPAYVAPPKLSFGLRFLRRRRG